MLEIFTYIHRLCDIQNKISIWKIIYTSVWIKQYIIITQRNFIISISSNISSQEMYQLCFSIIKHTLECDLTTIFIDIMHNKYLLYYTPLFYWFSVDYYTFMYLNF